MRRGERKESPTSGGLELYTEMKRPSTSSSCSSREIDGDDYGPGCHWPGTGLHRTTLMEGWRPGDGRTGTRDRGLWGVRLLTTGGC